MAAVTLHITHNYVWYSISMTAVTYTTHAAVYGIAYKTTERKIARLLPTYFLTVSDKAFYIRIIYMRELHDLLHR